MEKIEKMGHFLVPSSTSEGVVDALRSLADKLNEIIDHLNSQSQPEEKAMTKEDIEYLEKQREKELQEGVAWLKQILDDREREAYHDGYTDGVTRCMDSLNKLEEDKNEGA